MYILTKIFFYNQEEDFNEHSFKHYQHDGHVARREDLQNVPSREEQRIVRVKNSPSRSFSPKKDSSRERAHKSVVRKTSASPPAAYAKAETENDRLGQKRERRSRSPVSRNIRKPFGSEAYLRSRSRSPHASFERRRSRSRSPHVKHGHASSRDHYWDREFDRHDRGDRSHQAEARRGGPADHHRNERAGTSASFGQPRRTSYELAGRHSQRKFDKHSERSDYSARGERYERDTSQDNKWRENAPRKAGGSAVSRELSSSRVKSAEKTKVGRERSRSDSCHSVEIDEVSATETTSPSSASKAIKQGVQQRIKNMLEEKCQADSKAKEMAKKQKEAELLNKIKQLKQRADDDLRKVIEVKSEAAAAAAAAAVASTIPLPATTDLRQVIVERSKVVAPLPDQRRVIEREPTLVVVPPYPPPLVSGNAGVFIGRQMVRNVNVLDSRSEQVVKQQQQQMQTNSSSSLPTLSQLCPICWTRFFSVDDLLLHFRSAHFNQMFTCLLCQRGNVEHSLGWTLDILLKHLGDSHNSSLTAAEAFKEELLALPGISTNVFLKKFFI